MSITEQILQALSTPSLDDPSMGVWFNGKSEADSWIKITREINTDSGTLLPDGRWVPKPDPTAYTYICLLYTSPSPRDLSTSRMPSSA